MSSSRDGKAFDGENCGGGAHGWEWGVCGTDVCENRKGTFCIEPNVGVCDKEGLGELRSSCDPVRMLRHGKGTANRPHTFPRGAWVRCCPHRSNLASISPLVVHWRLSRPFRLLLS